MNRILKTTLSVLFGIFFCFSQSLALTVDDVMNTICPLDESVTIAEFLTDKYGSCSWNLIDVDVQAACDFYTYYHNNAEMRNRLNSYAKLGLRQKRLVERLETYFSKYRYIYFLFDANISSYGGKTRGFIMGNYRRNHFRILILNPKDSELIDSGFNVEIGKSQNDLEKFLLKVHSILGRGN